MRQSDNSEFLCSPLSNTSVKCIFFGAPINTENVYNIDGAKITWIFGNDSTGTAVGSHNGKDTITWSAGNVWIKQEGKP